MFSTFVWILAISKALSISIDPQTQQNLRKNVDMTWMIFQRKSVKFKSGPIDGAMWPYYENSLHMPKFPYLSILEPLSNQI